MGCYGGFFGLKRKCRQLSEEEETKEHIQIWDTFDLCQKNCNPTPLPTVLVDLIRDYSKRQDLLFIARVPEI